MLLIIFLITLSQLICRESVAMIAMGLKRNNSLNTSYNEIPSFKTGQDLFNATIFSKNERVRL